MQISTLREFLELADNLSFSHVARSLFVSQSSLSKHIEAIEKELGVKLFTRDKHSVRLTEMGRLFNKRIKSVIEQYDNVIEELKCANKGMDRLLKVGYLHGATRLFLAEAAAVFEAKHSDTILNLYSEEAGTLLPDLRNNKLDIAITMKLPGDNTSNYKHLDLYKDCLNVVVSDKHKLANREDVSLSELAAERVLVPTRCSLPNVYAYFRRVLNDPTFWLNVEELIHDVNSPLPYLLANTGVVITFHHLRSYYGKRTVFLPIRGIDTGFTVSAFWKPSRENDTLMSFVNTLKLAVMPVLEVLED